MSGYFRVLDWFDTSSWLLIGVCTLLSTAIMYGTQTSRFESSCSFADN